MNIRPPVAINTEDHTSSATVVGDFLVAIGSRLFGLKGPARLKLPGEDREMPPKHKRAERHRVPWKLHCQAVRDVKRVRRSLCAVVLRRWAQVVRTHRRLGPHRLLVVRALWRWEAAARCVWFQRACSAGRLIAAWRWWALFARESAQRAVLSFWFAEAHAPALLSAAWKQWMLFSREPARRAVLTFWFAGARPPNRSELRCEARARSRSSPP